MHDYICVYVRVCVCVLVLTFTLCQLKGSVWGWQMFFVASCFLWHKVKAKDASKRQWNQQQRGEEQKERRQGKSGNWTRVQADAKHMKHIAWAGGDITVTYSQIYRKYIFQHREKETAQHRQGQSRQDTHTHRNTHTYRHMQKIGAVGQADSQTEREWDSNSIS